MHLNNRVTLLSILHAFVFRVACHYSAPGHVQLWDSGAGALEHMVDVTNRFGLRVLYEHNFLNQNNIAFSPYGLTGILVALFEGIEGDSSYQIQRSLELPWNRNVLRIGFRDIHRTLKTYFIPEEGFLAGLALNNENVTFKEEYRNVLRFYGFDLESDRLPTFPPKEDNATTTSAPNDAPTTNSNKEETTAATTSPADTSSAEPREPTTPASNVQEPTVTTAAVAADTSSVADAESPVSMTSAPTTQSSAVEDAVPSTESSSAPSESPIESTIIPSTPGAALQSEAAPPASEGTAPTPIDDGVEIISTSSLIALAATTSATELTTESSTATPPTQTSESTPSTVALDENPPSTAEPTGNPMQMQTETTPAPSPLETLQRRKKSILDFIMERFPPYDEYLYTRPIEYSPGNVPAFSGEKMFLANGLKNVEVAYMTYDTVLEYSYLPHFKASALKLPLDNDDYYLLVVLPDYEFELNNLIKRLAQESNLRDIYSSLQYRYVRACVPSFMVKGFVTLTTDLQRLGIRDVFEPRQNDFSPMTTQKGVYVRNVEQAITVTIRKYEKRTSQAVRHVLDRHPVHLSATYPFLYFVMDSTIHVSLMAGKVMDPLNTRVI